MRGSTYTYNNSQEKTFVDAELACKQEGGQLASIDSEYTRDLIFNRLKEYDTSLWWIGLQKHDQQWKWSNGLNLNRTIITFTEQVSSSCGCLYQPGVGRRALLYDYGCSTDESFYICESGPAHDTDNQPVHGLNNKAMITSLISLSIVAAVVLILTFLVLKVKRNSIRDETLNPSTTDQPARNIQDGSVSGNNFDEDAGYATIDGVIYSEIDLPCDEEVNENEDKKHTEPTAAVTYAQILHKPTASYDLSHQYAKVDKKRKCNDE